MNKLKFLQQENKSNLKMKFNLTMTKMKFDREMKKNFHPIPKSIFEFAMRGGGQGDEISILDVFVGETRKCQPFELQDFSCCRTFLIP